MNNTIIFIISILILGIFPFIAAIIIVAIPFAFLSYIYYITLKFIRVRKLDIKKTSKYVNI